MPGVLLIEGDSRCGLKAGRLLMCDGGRASPGAPSGTIAAALAEKKPAPWGGRPDVSPSSEFKDRLLRWAGDAGADGGPIPERLG